MMNGPRRAGLALALVAIGVSGFCLRAPRSDGASSGAPAAPAALPRIALSRDDALHVTKIELTKPPDDDDPSEPRGIVLEKLESAAPRDATDSTWEIASPVRTRASASKVRELLENLGRLDVREAVEGGGPAIYPSLKLTGDDALHVVVWSGATKARDLYFGKSDARGQLARTADGPGAFVVANRDKDGIGRGGYSGFLYTRTLRSWRDPSIFAFDAAQVTAFTITNPHGLLSFARSEAGWSATIAPRRSDGALDPPRALARLNRGIADGLPRAYASLAADDFGDANDARPGGPAGVDDAEHTGGVVRITLGSGDALVLRVGRTLRQATRWTSAESRWAVREGGDGTLYALSTFTWAFATADAAFFERPTPAP